MVHAWASIPINIQSVQTDSITHLLLDPLGFSTCRGWSHLTQTRCTEGENRRFLEVYTCSNSYDKTFQQISRERKFLYIEETNPGGSNYGTKLQELMGVLCLILRNQTDSWHDMTVWPKQSPCSPSEPLLGFVHRWFHLNLSLKENFDISWVGDVPPPLTCTS